MNKVKQIFKLSSFALLSCFMAASGVILSTITPKTATADVVQESITNTLPVFFDNGDPTSEVYFDASASTTPDNNTAAVVKFDFEAQHDMDVDGTDDTIKTLNGATYFPGDSEYSDTSATTGDDINIYRYYPDGLDTSDEPKPINPYHYYYININSITLTLNGSELVYQTGGGTPNDFILASNAPSYFERTFYPESLNFQIELNTTSSPKGYNASIAKRSEDVDIATLTLYEEGLLNVSIGYTLYDVTLTPAQPGATAPTEAYTTLTGQQFDYSIFMFSSDTYFESSSSANPARVNFNANNTVRTPSESSSHSYNYFYNYSSRGTTTNELPYLTYDPFRYQLTLTKSLNNTTTSQSVVFNPETHDFEAPDFVYSMQFEQETGLMKIYFNDLGLYNLSFDMIYSYATTSAAEGVTYHSYDLSPTVRDQKLYVYGAQMSYTDYETGSFAEFKSIENNSITQAADITRAVPSVTGIDFKTSCTDGCATCAEEDCTCLNCTSDGTTTALTPTGSDPNPLKTYLEGNTPVVTDQTPVKLSTYGSNFKAMLYTKGDSGWSAGQNISTTRNLSDDGEYLLAVEYNFANYTSSSGTIDTAETFYQYFYFKIEKTTPEVEVEKFVPNSTETEDDDWANLASGQYTNQNVKITYSSDSSEFDADVFIYLSQYNFSDSLVRRQRIYPAIGSDWDMTDGVLEIANSENGRYLLQIYYGRNALQQQPITRSFYIDTQPITGLQAFAVGSSSNRYFSDGALDSSAGELYGTATNQAFAFGWENVKQSRAGTQGYVRYYPLENFDDYYTGSANTATLISDLLRDYDVLPTTMKLNLSTSPNWTEYSNASTFPSTSIGGECVESAAGLYVFQIFDDAGNSAAAYVFLDSSAPQFVLYEENVGYRLISNNETINSNATVYWSDAKAIMINVGDGGSFAYDNFGTHLLQNHMQSGTEKDEQLLALFNAFVGGASATNIENLNLTTATGRNGTYYIVDILDQIAFAERSPENLELRTFETNSYDIEFSFSIHYTQDATSGSTVFYKSTTIQNVYENMQTGEDVLASDGKIDHKPLNDADIYQTLSQSGERTFYYGTQGSTTLTNLTTGESVTMTTENGTNYIGSLQATAVEFVDMEGSYSFLIRDTSNTTGRNAVSELVRFSSYPSASQYITVSADTSSVQVNYKEDDTSNQLFLASYYSTNGTGSESTRQSYYTPTSYEGVLNISFKPTVDTTQIDTLTLAYYPYETRFVANRAANGYVQLSFYRTLAAQPSLPNTIYSFDQNGAAASNETRTYQVNVPDTMTAEGKYVLTRTYMTGEGYTINNFDYATRELTFYVDRNNVITETSTVMADAQTYTLVIDSEDSDYTLTIYGNLFIIEGPEGWLEGSTEVTFTGDNAPTSYEDGNRYWNMGNYSYYIMPEDFEFASLSIEIGGATYTTAGVSPDASSLSTMESVVGGDIFVNMYDAQPGDSGSILSVTFPNTTLTDGITLGSGETFFTDDREIWESITPSPILQTNKLPVKVYIPEFKYTIFNSETYNNEDASVSYESNENPLLSYYDQNAQAISQIAAYRLSAVITDSHGATYASNGVDENGYLTFVSTADGSTLTELSQEGTYTVEITQNATGSGAGTENDFKKSYKFAFNITQSSPEFSLSTVGRALETLGDENYYTNQKTFTATWVDQNSPYIANIDKAHILLEFSNNYSNNMIVDVSSGTPSVVLAENGETTAQTELVQRALDYQISGYNNTLTLNFEDAGIYNQDAWVRVTMQFVGHNAEYYEVTTKTVTIDKIASYDSLDTLIANVSPFSNGTVTFNETTLRKYFNVEGTPVRGKTEAAYNTSVSSGNLQYYSYLVDNAFLQNLARAAAANNNFSHEGRTIRVYYRAIDNPYSGTYIETSYDNFTPTNFTELSSEDLDSGYYEIVEQDLAGNLTIYLVYLYSENSDDGFAATVDEYGNITDEDDDSISYSEEYIAALQGIQFIDGDRLVQISDAQILAQQTSGRVVEMFSSKNFSLEKLNLRGDAWLTLTVSQANTTARSYLFSPWLAESQMVIDMQSGQTVSFDQIFAEFVSSSSSSLEINLQISNRAQGGTLQAALNLANGASLTANYSSSQTEEYLSIRRSDLVYPVSVKINLGNEEEPYYYNVSNDPNALENLQNSSYSYLNSWTTDKISFLYDFERLLFKFITLPASNTKVRYEIKDNFGNVTTLIHIFGETYFEPVTSSGNFYQDLISNPDMNDDSEDFFTVYVSGDDVIYHYNSSIYAVYVTYWDGAIWTNATEDTDYTSTDSGNITSLTFSRGDAAQIDRWFRIYVDEIPDDDPDYEINVGITTNRVDNIFIHLYEMRPELDVPRDEGVAEPEYLLTFRDHYGENVTGDILADDETYETVTVGGRDYRVTSQGSTFALNLTVDYTDPSSLDYPYEVLYYNAATMSGFENLPSRTTINESGIYYFLVRYAQNANGVLANEYDLYKIEILDSASEFYRVTNNGVLVERAPSYYTYAGTQYSDYYIVNVNYNQDSASVQIVPNDYQQITYRLVESIPEGNGVVTVQYRVTNYDEYDNPPTTPGVSAFNRYVFVTFIPPTSNPVPSAVYYFNQNEQFDMLSSSSISAVVPRENTSQDTVTIRWTSSYGISSNYVYINVLKDGTAFFNSEDMTAASQALVSYRTDGDFNYITLNRSGTYTISFSDEAGNQQAFASNVRALRFVFLKDVAFSMTYTDASTGEQIVSDPIQKGVFNGSVGLTILNMSDYYTAASTGSGEGMIRVSRNGATYSGYTYDATSHTFTFSEPGYYSVSFVATSISGVEVREQTYNFTIVNPNESRYSFEFAPYQDYYITSVVKDNLGDISGDIIANMQSYGLNLQTISIDGQTYLRELVTSYIGLGSGRYTVTIATRSSYNRENYSEPTEMTFSYWINTASVPIDIGLQEGASTSSPITVSFNAERIYQAVGECMVTIGLNTYYITGENASSFGVVNAPAIEASGTYFITVRSMSGNLLFSYKVIKTEPLNGWAIAAIVIGCVVAIAAVIIIVKLRKRIKVK